MSDPLYPRFAEAPLLEALAGSPAVLVHGPRQCGKTTLARMVGEARGYVYSTFDDEVARAAGLRLCLKLAIDRRRTPGRFNLTGPTNSPAPLTA